MAYSDTQTILETTVDVSANSTYVDVGDSMKYSIQLIASGIVSGNGVFTVQVSNDGTNWLAYNRLTTNVTNTNVQTDTRVASVTLSSNTSAFVFFPAGDHFKYLRVNVDVTTDGTYSAVLHRVIST